MRLRGEAKCYSSQGMTDDVGDRRMTKLLNYQIIFTSMCPEISELD